MKISRLAGFVAFALVMAGMGAVQAQQICVSNALFELPNTSYATGEVCMWDTIPPQGENDDAIGVFTNDPDFGPDYYIVNCVGTQAAYIYSDDGLALYQVLPATYTVGQACQLIAGVIGGPQSEDNPAPADGAILVMSLFYLDSSSNIVTIAATNIVNTTNLFPNITEFVNCELDIPPVNSSDAWAGQNIGVEFTAVVPDDVEPGGNWDLNNVQLFATPCFLNPAVSNGQFSATFKSQPGLIFEILGTTNLSTPVLNWPTVVTVTNVTGTMPFCDTATNGTTRFYEARQYRNLAF